MTTRKVREEIILKQNRKSLCDAKKDVQLMHNKLMSGTPVFVFDLETTGLKTKKDRILSFSAIKVRYKNGSPVIEESKNVFIDPQFTIPAEIVRITGISNETVKGCPTEIQAYEQIREFLGETPLLMGYNSVSFDVSFLNNMYLRCAGEFITPEFHLDVMKMAKEKLALPNYKLMTVAHELGADMDIKFHQSIDDVIATYRSFQQLMPMYFSEEEKPKIKANVYKLNYWEGPSYRLKRVYVYTNPGSKTYYDIFKKEWVSDICDLDLNDVRNQVMTMINVFNEKDMVAKVKNLA